jgi:tetratricopeptide (TPR) repeat protein
MKQTPISPVGDGRWIIVDNGRKIFAQQILEGIRKFDSVIKDFSVRFESNLVVLDLPPENFVDLCACQFAYRTLQQQNDLFFDAKDNEDILEKLDSEISDKTKFIDELYEGSTFFIDHLYWKNYEKFCLKILERFKEIELTKNEVLKKQLEGSLMDLFFPERDNEDQILKKFRKLSMFFHTDRAPMEYKDCCGRMFNCLTSMRETIINTLNDPFDTDEQKMYDYVIKGKEWFDLAMNFKDILKKKKGETVGNHLPVNWETFLSLTEVELIERKKAHAYKSCSFYQSAIRIVDKLAKNDLNFLQLQIEYRKKTSQAFFLGAHLIESQLYCVAALHLATDLENPTTTVKDLQSLLNTILNGTTQTVDQMFRDKYMNKGNEKAEAQDTDSEKDKMDNERRANEDQRKELHEMSQALVFATKADVKTKSQRAALKQSVKKATTEIILRNAIRADSSLVEYRTPAEEIEYTRKLATLFTAGGIVLKTTAVAVATAPVVVVGAAVLASTEAVSLPLILTTTSAVIASGPVGWTIGAGFLVLGLTGGSYLLSKGRSAGKEPERRVKLNEIMSKAVELYQKGDFEEMFEKLSEKFVDDQLLHFEKQKKIEIDEKKIVKTLLSHHFRCDGIALLLHMISEGFICADLKLQEAEQGRGWLIERAKQIMKYLLESKELTENAVSLDTLVYQSKSRLFNQATQSISRYFQGIPASYVRDARIAPFTARLEEIRTLSLINRVTIMALDNDEYFEKNVKLVKRRLKENFQYFSVSTFRIDALRDFLIAIRQDISLDDEDEGYVHVHPHKAQDVANKQILDQPFISKLRLGNEFLTCINEESVGNFTFAQFLTKISSELFENNYKVIQYFTEHFDNESSNYDTEATLGAVNGRRAPPPPPPILAELKIVLAYLKSQFDAFGNGGVVSLEFFRLAARSIKHCLGIHLIFVESIDKSAAQGNLKALFGLSAQEMKNVSADEWQRNVCVAKVDTGSATSLLSFQILLDKNLKDKSLIEFEAAVNLQQARKYLNFAKNHRNIATMVESMRLYDKAINYFLKTLYCFDSTWQVSFASLYQFVEVQALVSSLLNFRKSSALLSERPRKTEEIDSVISLMECYSSMFKYSKTLELATVCINRTEFAEHPLFWYWYAVAARKSTFYFDGSYAIQKSLGIAKTKDSEREFNISKKLHETEITKTVKEYVDTSLQYSFDRSLHSKKRNFYDILSIDGGGIKGIIPAYWISTVERRCHAPIAKLVNMIAGTSTGAIIAGALSVNAVNSENPIPAHHLVNLYSDHTLIKDVFCKRFSFGGVLGPRYHDYRYKVIKTFVGADTLISNTITDVLIASVRENAKQTTHCFTSMEAKSNVYDLDCNVKLVDAIMASSAAPTYFPSYKINQSSFIDGGMQANNPAALAYHEAQSNGHQNIRIWSVGTGDYISSRESDYNPLRGALYWASNAYDIAVASQQGLIDRELSVSLLKDYQRWQVWMHEPIVLDDCSEPKLKSLIEHARQFVEEADESDENPINKLVEKLLANNE